jgi:amino acid adenylation domain-containing protein
MLSKSDGFANDLAAAFWHNARIFRDRPAIHIDGRTYTYDELSRIVEGIRVSAERIAIYGRRNIYAYASILACLTAGAAWIPLNPLFPRSRLDEILRSSRASYVIDTEGDFETQLEIPSYTIDALPETKPVSQPLAYILFTSGSTGAPKGVPVSYKNLQSFFSWFRNNYSFTGEDRFLQVYELSFDVSVFSFMMPLLSGSCCYILPSEGFRPVTIIEQCRLHEITVLSMVPSVVSQLRRYLPEINLPALRYSFFSGDALYREDALEWMKCIPNAVLHNFYGPTETTIVCMRHIVDSLSESTAIIPIGSPFEGMEYVILDEELRPAPTGELCLSGAQVIDTYLDQHEEKFITIDDKRFYRTGDRVERSDSGELIFLGRCDRQLKIGGYRIEPAEIEQAAISITGKAAVVVVDRHRNSLLLVVNGPEFPGLKQRIAEQLPFYMIPQKIVFAEDLPLGVNGKYDAEAISNMYL